MKKSSKNMLIYVLILAAIIIFGVLVSGNGTNGRRIEYHELLSWIQEELSGKSTNHAIERVSIRGTSLVGRLENSTVSLADYPGKYDFETTIGADFVDTVRAMVYKEKKNSISDYDQISVADFPFEVEYMAPVSTPWILQILPELLLMVMLIGFSWYLIRMQTGGGGRVNNFSRSHANLVDPNKNKTTFADVAGADEEKEELKEIVDFLKSPQTYIELGARVPKGVLLVGPPGTGKTLLARAVAGEAGVPFYSISGSDFVELFVGVGASRVRDLFDQAKRNAPSIVFIDEIDAVGRHRGAGLGGGHDEREQTLNQLLVEMDGFNNNQGVIVMAATNRRDILDPALLRPGRFDRQITVNYPDVQGREDIIKVHAKGKPFADDVDFSYIAKRTPFATGAELENIMNEAAILAARARSKVITQEMLSQAVERIQMGPEKRSHKVLEQEKRMVAYHESGHALVAHYLPLCDDVQLVTIVPRGNGAGGYTLVLPDKEGDFSTKKQLLQDVSMMLGGHAAEKLILGDNSNGATSDLQRATQLVKSMVTKFGMSDELGTIYLGSDEQVFVGMEFGQTRAYSEETAARIDAEVGRILKACYDDALSVLEEHREELEALAGLLIEKETINRTEFLKLLGPAEEPSDPETRETSAPDISEAVSSEQPGSPEEKELDEPAVSRDQGAE